jgi:hypothetical protein
MTTTTDHCRDCGRRYDAHRPAGWITTDAGLLCRWCVRRSERGLPPKRRA